jgi:GNAT superfamily N-acetyltransferase
MRVVCYANEFVQSRGNLLVLLQCNPAFAQEILAAVSRANAKGFRFSPEQILKAASMVGKPPLAVLQDIVSAATRRDSASASSEQTQLPAGWHIRSELTRSGGKIELFDARGTSKGVAFVQPSVANNQIARLTGISISANQQAQGFGAALHARLEQELRALGFVAIEASPLPGTERFYQRLGYAQDSNRPTGPWIKPLDSAGTVDSTNQPQAAAPGSNTPPTRRAYRFEPNDRGGYRVVETTPDKAQFFEENGVRYMHSIGLEQARIDRATGTVSSATGQTSPRGPARSVDGASASQPLQPASAPATNARAGKLSSNNIFLGKIQPLSGSWVQPFTYRLDVSAFELSRGLERDPAAQQVLEAQRQRVVADVREVLLLYRTNIEVVFQGTAQKLDLSGTDLSGLDLRSVRFQGVTSSGQRVLREISLEGANLSRSDLRGVDLRHANLRNADLRGARLQGALLEGARLNDARQ